jgi:hypothetical protein
LIPTAVAFMPVTYAPAPIAVVPEAAAVAPQPTATVIRFAAVVVSVHAAPGMLTYCAYASSGALRPAATATAATVSTLSAGMPSKKPSTMPLMAPAPVSGERVTTLLALLPHAESSSDTATHAPRASFHMDR